jgi:formate-dependent nitrite reductase membrane component NrfD
MIEIASSRSNPLVDPSLHVWGFEIPVYLFLGGLVAGMMVLTGYFLLTGGERRAECTCHRLPQLGLALLSAGMLALFLDLEHKPYAWRLYTTFEVRSPMSWGAWILLLVYPVLLASLLVRPPSWLGRLGRIGQGLAARSAPARVVGALSLGAGALLGLYTGVLLSALGARPLWSSALLGPLFLVSGMSTAAALVHMLARDPGERVLLARADNVFLGLELGVLALFLVGLVTSTSAEMEAAKLLLGGPYTALFWVLVVGVGIVTPLAVQTLAVGERIAHTPVGPLLVLAGGLMLRFVIVYAGQLSRWSPA